MNEPRTLAIVISVMSLILIVVPCVVVTFMIFHDRYKVFKNRYHSLRMDLNLNRDERSRLMRENGELQNRVMELEDQIEYANNQLKRLETANGTLEHLRQTARDALSEIEHVADTCHLVVNRPSTPKVKESP